jgi:DNA-directed RNA polymerase specialized sigma24 family protein
VTGVLEAVARDYFEASASGDPARLRAVVGRLAPLLAPPLRAAVERQQALLRRGRVDAGDVLQRVFERLLTHPPENPRDRAPAAVLVTWARTVALRHLLDLARTARPLADEEEEPAAGPAQEQAFELRERLRVLRSCADAELGRHRHLREVFYALVDDPDLSARELAARIGLGAGDTEAARKAEQLVFKLRERVHVKLAECLARHERGGRR